MLMLFGRNSVELDRIW